MHTRSHTGLFSALSRQGQCLFLALFVGLLGGCGGSSDEFMAAGEDSPALYFTSGSPLELLAGAKNQKKSPVTLKTLDKFDGYGILSTNLFAQKTSTDPGLTPEEAQKPRETESRKVGVHRFRQINSTSFMYTNGDSQTELKFELRDDRLEWTEAFGKAVEVIHYSVAQDRKQWSLLGVYQTPQEGEVLVSIMLIKPERKSSGKIVIEKAKQVYNYLFGANVVARWKDAKTIYLCGSENKFSAQTLRKTQAQWQNALGDKLKIKIEARKEYPPFSDLNYSCVYWVDQYILDPREDVFFFGHTFSSAYLSEGELIDSDIFLFQSEFDKFKTKFPEVSLEEAIERTLIHEMGHLLGLHHIFDGTESIMSYNREDKNVSAYDREAVQSLYSNAP